MLFNDEAIEAFGFGDLPLLSGRITGSCRQHLGAASGLVTAFRLPGLRLGVCLLAAVPEHGPLKIANRLVVPLLRKKQFAAHEPRPGTDMVPRLPRSFIVGERFLGLAKILPGPTKL